MLFLALRSMSGSHHCQIVDLCSLDVSQCLFASAGIEPTHTHTHAHSRCKLPGESYLWPWDYLIWHKSLFFRNFVILFLWAVGPPECSTGGGVHCCSLLIMELFGQGTCTQQAATTMCMCVCVSTMLCECDCVGMDCNRSGALWSRLTGALNRPPSLCEFTGCSRVQLPETG